MDEIDAALGKFFGYHGHCYHFYALYLTHSCVGSKILETFQLSGIMLKTVQRMHSLSSSGIFDAILVLSL